MDLELKMAQMRLYESNHLLNIYNDKKYRGWYKCEIQNEIRGDIFNNIFIRFRLPPAIPVYKGMIRNFSEDERIAGIHRMLIGKDLKDDVEKLCDYKSINDYMKSLTDDEVKDLLERAKDIITFDCNKIPYLLIIEKATIKENYDYLMKNLPDSHPDYLDIFTKVLNKEMSIEEATEKSRGIIYNEFANLKNNY